MMESVQLTSSPEGLELTVHPSKTILGICPFPLKWSEVGPTMQIEAWPLPWSELSGAHLLFTSVTPDRSLSIHFSKQEKNWLH